MIWEGCVAVLLSLAGYATAQPPTIPVLSEGSREVNITQNGIEELVLDKRLKEQEVADSIRDKAPMLPELIFKCLSYVGVRDLERARNVCKMWKWIASAVLEKRGDPRIVCIPTYGKQRKDDLELLQTFDDEGAMRCWHPKLLLLFLHIPAYENYFGEHINIVQNLPVNNGKCFMAENKFKDLALRCGTPMECLAARSEHMQDLNGCILPEALLRNFDVDVIFPPLHIFRPWNPLFCRQAEANKKSFANYFGWKEEVTIKLAFIFARETYGDEIPEFYPLTFDSMAQYRTEQITRWLRSLPEGDQMKIFSIPTQGEIRSKRRLPATGIDKDTAVLLFGGDKLLLETCVMDHVCDERGEIVTEEQVLKALKKRVEKWPETSQKIIFSLSGYHHYEVFPIFRKIFRGVINQKFIKLSTMGFNKKSNVDSTAIVIVGFPQDSKSRTDVEAFELETSFEDSELETSSENIQQSSPESYDYEDY